MGSKKKTEVVTKDELTSLASGEALGVFDAKIAELRSSNPTVVERLAAHLDALRSAFSTAVVRRCVGSCGSNLSLDGARTLVGQHVAEAGKKFDAFLGSLLEGEESANGEQVLDNSTAE